MRTDILQRKVLKPIILDTYLCMLIFFSVRTSISMQFFPRFFLLYFLVFHIYFFSYTYGKFSRYPYAAILRVREKVQWVSFFFIKLLISWRQKFCFSMTYALLYSLPGFSYLAFSATAAFMQHLILYFWNRFEVS